MGKVIINFAQTGLGASNTERRLQCSAPTVAYEQCCRATPVIRFDLKGIKYFVFSSSSSHNFAFSAGGDEVEQVGSDKEHTHIGAHTYGCTNTHRRALGFGALLTISKKKH